MLRPRSECEEAQCRPAESAAICGKEQRQLTPKTKFFKTLILLNGLFSFIFSDEIGPLNEQVSKEYGGTKYRYHHIKKHSPDIKESINLKGKEVPNGRSDKPCEDDKGKTNGSMEKKCPFTHHHLRDIHITDKCRGNNRQ